MIELWREHQDVASVFVIHQSHKIIFKVTKFSKQKPRKTHSRIEMKELKRVKLQFYNMDEKVIRVLHERLYSLPLVLGIPFYDAPYQATKFELQKFPTITLPQYLFLKTPSLEKHPDSPLEDGQAFACIPTVEHSRTDDFGLIIVQLLQFEPQFLRVHLFFICAIGSRATRRGEGGTILRLGPVENASRFGDVAA